MGMSYNTIPYHTIPYHTIPYHTIPYRTIPYHTIPYRTIPYHTIPYHTIPYHTIPNSAYGAITSCKIQFWMSFHLLSTSLPADFATNRLATVPLHRTRESQLDIGDSSL